MKFWKLEISENNRVSIVHSCRPVALCYLPRAHTSKRQSLSGFHTMLHWGFFPFFCYCTDEITSRWYSPFDWSSICYQVFPGLQFWELHQESQCLLAVKVSLSFKGAMQRLLSPTKRGRSFLKMHWKQILKWKKRRRKTYAQTHIPWNQ